MTDWWLDELVTAGPEHLDSGYVDGYDAKSQVDPDEDIELLTALGLSGTSTVLDVGAGTGVFAIAAARTGASVIAVDISPAMTAALRRRADQQGLSNLTVVDAGFLSYDHVGDQVDFVYTRNALHQLPDFWKVVALRNIARILRPGGILRLRDLVFDTTPERIEQTIEAWIGRAVEDPSRGYTAAEFAEHVRSEHSTFTWLLESMLRRTGFKLLDQDVRVSVYAAYTCQHTTPAEPTD
jgi:ubiquinone/menaquinone biosynthesis C-methylase UbiE